jgi:hypothetical protein
MLFSDLATTCRVETFDFVDKLYRLENKDIENIIGTLLKMKHRNYPPEFFPKKDFRLPNLDTGIGPNNEF